MAPEGCPPITSVERLDVKPGETLLVRVGLSAEEMGAGLAWLPSPDELERVRAEITSLLPEGVLVLVTHLGIRAAVASVDLDEEDRLYGGSD